MLYDKRYFVKYGFCRGAFMIIFFAVPDDVGRSLEQLAQNRGMLVEQLARYWAIDLTGAAGRGDFSPEHIWLWYLSCRLR